MAEPLGVATLGDEGEQAVLRALGELYLRLDRLQEAITIAREARVSQYAAPEGRVAGTGRRAVDGKRWGEARKAAESRWRDSDPDFESLTGIRNTLNHAGFGAQPTPAAAVRTQVAEQVGRIGAPVDEPVGDPEPEGEG